MTVWIVARKSDGEAMAVYANEADATEDVSIRHRRHRDRYKVEAWQVSGAAEAGPAAEAAPDDHWHRGPSTSCSICRFGASGAGPPTPNALARIIADLDEEQPFLAGEIGDEDGVVVIAEECSPRRVAERLHAALWGPLGAIVQEGP